MRLFNAPCCWRCCPVRWQPTGLSLSFKPDNHLGSRYNDITILNRNGHLLR